LYSGNKFVCCILWFYSCKNNYQLIGEKENLPIISHSSYKMDFDDTHIYVQLWTKYLSINTVINSIYQNGNELNWTQYGFLGSQFV